MERRPAAYGYQQCPYRNGRQAVPTANSSVRPSQPPRMQQAQTAPARTAPPRQNTVQAVPVPPPPPPAQFTRAWLSAYAKDFTLTMNEGEHKRPLPLEVQRSEGGMAVAHGCTTAPEDGYYMLLWELGVGNAEGVVTLQLGINEAASQLTYALHPGYDSGQQVTWLSAGDKAGLFLQAENGYAEVQCASAQFTVIRLG